MLGIHADPGCFVAGCLDGGLDAIDQQNLIAKMVDQHGCFIYAG